jgi:hypothetical protein
VFSHSCPRTSANCDDASVCFDRRSCERSGIALRECVCSHRWTGMIVCPVTRVYGRSRIVSRRRRVSTGGVASEAGLRRGSVCAVTRLCEGVRSCVRACSSNALRRASAPPNAELSAAPLAGVESEPGVGWRPPEQSARRRRRLVERTSGTTEATAVCGLDSHPGSYRASGVGCTAWLGCRVKRLIYGFLKVSCILMFMYVAFMSFRESIIC